jgi:hypothetical protein
MTQKMPTSDVDRLEAKLEAALKRVVPRPEYKHYLRDRLVTPPSDLRVELVRTNSKKIILAAVGLTGGVIFLIAGIRLLALYARGGNHRLSARGSG